VQASIGVHFPVVAIMQIFLFTITPRPALRLVQPPTQWVRGSMSLGLERPGREADLSPPSSAEVKNVRSHTSTP
jgi:hypothetical protein